MAPNEKKPTNANAGNDVPTTSNQNFSAVVTSQTRLANGERRLSGSSSTSVESFENYIPTPPDGGWGWVIVAASLVNNLIVDGIGYSFGVFLVEFTDYFQSTKSKVSLVGSLLCGVYLFVGPIVSALTNKFGCRLVAFAGAVIAGASFVLATFAPSVDVLIITYGVMGGFGLGLVYLPSIVSVGYYFERKRALATGIAVCGSGIGTFIFAPLSEFLLKELDWKNALLVIAGITLQGCVCAMLMRPLLPPDPDSQPKRPRTKNLLDRIKEQTRGNRNRTISETSQYAYSVRDNNAVLERVMAAKLLRERRLQDDDSELGSLPSVFFVKGQGRKDSRVHKLSLSDRGDVSSHLNSPSAPNVPRIVVQDGATEGVVEGGALPALTEGIPVNIVRASNREDPPGETTESVGCGSPDTPRKGTEDALSSGGEEFTDAETGTVGEGTIPDTETATERSDYFTPPASPLVSSPTTPDRVTSPHPVTTPERVTSPTPADDREDPEVSSSQLSDPQEPPLTHDSCGGIVRQEALFGKQLTNGSVPHHLCHHIQEVTPLIKQAPSKTTVVTLGSEKNIWRLKQHLHGSHGPEIVGPSLHSLSVSKKDLARPLYRKDIFYSGSIAHIPQFRSQPDMKSYITSVTTIPGELAFLTGESKIWRYLCLPQSCKDTLQEMLDFSLLKDGGFMMVMLGNVLAFLGFYVPFVFSVDYAVSLDIESDKAALLISIIGITNTVGRVLTGWLADLQRVNSLVITYVSIFLCGLATAVFPFCKTYETLCVAAAVFGLFVAAFISLSSILICDLLGLEKLTNGFGLMTMFRGLAAMAGPPLAGFVYDRTKSYDASFYLGGGLLVAGAACHLALKLPCFNRQPDMVVEMIEEIDNEAGSDFRPEIVAIEEVTSHV